jgi:putative SOS response-associated peptidase YedK
MCLEIAFNSTLQLIDDYFPNLTHDGEIDFGPERGRRFSALDHDRYPVILQENGHYHRNYFEWGIIAEYMDTPEKIKATRKSMVSARSEKMLEDKRSFWNSIRHTRCLIPVTGIYESRQIKDWEDKVPYHIQLRDRKLFCIPGLYHYNTKRPPDPETGEMPGFFALLTRPANSVLRQIHNSGNNAFRMPLLLPKEMELEWLRPGLTNEEMATLLAYEMPSDQIVYDPESKHPDLPPLGNDEAGSSGHFVFA